MSIVFFISALTLSAQSQEGVVISFELEQRSVTLHEPVYVAFSIHNGLDQEIKVDLGHNYKSNFEFTIVEPNGVSTRLLKLSEEGMGRIGRVSLKPKQDHRQRLLLNEWYQFTQVGNYKINASLSSPIQTISGTSVKPMLAQQLSLQVVARDPERLKDIGQKLAKTAVESSVVTQATEAALALSYMDDPVVVPYLNQMLREGVFVKTYSIAGLGRIANVEAIDILIVTTKTGDSEVASLARNTLARIEPSIQDPALKRKIHNALQSQPGKINRGY